MHIIWEALNCLPSVMFECQVSHLSMTCIFKPAWLLIAFQQQVADITIHMSKNDGLENYLKKKKFFFFLDFHIREVLPHSRECGSWAAFPGGSRMIREGSHVWSFDNQITSPFINLRLFNVCLQWLELLEIHPLLIFLTNALYDILFV